MGMTDSGGDLLHSRGHRLLDTPGSRGGLLLDTPGSRGGLLLDMTDSRGDLLLDMTDSRGDLLLDMTDSRGDLLLDIVEGDHALQAIRPPCLVPIGVLGGRHYDQLVSLLEGEILDGRKQPCGIHAL